MSGGRHEAIWTDLTKINAAAIMTYMYHCHILEHEDRGMMGQFTVS